MKLREQLLRHRKDNRWIVGGLAVLLLILTAIYYFLQSSRDLPSELVTNRVLLFILWYVNLTLILAILFVLLRNLFKLVVERRYRILGSRFKTKLVATYIGLSLLPGLLLFAYGSQMLKGWINRWFEEPAIREVTSQGYAVAQGLYRQAVETRQRDTARALREISDIDLENPRRRPRLDRLMRQLLDELDLDYLAVYSQTAFVHAVLDPESELTDLPEPSERLLVETLRDREAQRWQNLPGDRGRLLLTARSTPDRGTAPRAVVIAGSLLDPELASQSRDLIQAYQGYRQLEVGKEEIEAGYMLTFLMVTLLILLASSWTGIYLARRIMVPIQALAEATKRVSEGDLDVQVSVEADDEIGVLVRSFNSMTAELQRKEELLEESNQELVSSNRRLAEERAVIGAVLQNLAAGVISVDEKGRILTCNGAALKMLDQPEGGLVGKPVSEVWNDPERGKLRALFEVDAGRARRVEREVRLVLGGQWRTFNAKVTTMADERGRISGRVMVLEEMTQLIRAQQMAAWSEAARRIAHEIKNPLTPIKLSAERLLRKHRQDAPGLGTALEEGVEIITREVEAMKGMVDEFSRFARMPRALPTEVDLDKLVEETLGLYDGLKEGIEVHGRVAADARRAMLDPEQIKRALINLLDNAMEAMEPPGDIGVAVARSNGDLLIDVSDTGPGIEPRAKNKLFLPHFSTKGRGTGLGLSIVHRIVTDHHGTIRVEDNEPRGTVFRIVLPQG